VRVCVLMCNDKPNFFNFILTVLRFFKYFYDIVSQGSDLELKKERELKVRWLQAWMEYR
jgi:hypothetical protein